jgi:hypothetical protein
VDPSWGQSRAAPTERRGQKKGQEVDLGRRSVHRHEDAPARLHHTRHLADAPRLVRKRHDAELRAGHIEGVLLEFQIVAVHHARVDVEALPAGALREERQHGGRQIRRQDSRAQPRRREAQRTASGGDVEKAHTRRESGTA